MLREERYGPSCIVNTHNVQEPMNIKFLLSSHRYIHWYTFTLEKQATQKSKVD